MAHIAPRSPTAQLGATSSAQHFRVFVGQMEQLYISNRRHFPPETTAWGFYLTGVHEITDELKAIASHRFAILGLRNRHTGYHPFEGPNRRDEIRACLQLIGPGVTHFYIEYVLMENMMLPRPSPDRQAPRGTALSESNFLVWSANAGKAIQMFYGQPVEPGQLSGTYEIRCANPNGVIAWPRYNFDTRQWFDNRASKAVLNSGHVRADIDSASPSDKSTKRKKLIRVELTRQLRSGSDEEEAWI
ncbi:hypothetical protein LTR57_025049 [Friedmanniomyces endolithicus]|nr:hypothetical protein LTS02_017265 [Friedmanniomyces endolithicus]KAK0890668.1 hypothetical protein LTR57_025049 [Friedmanniomyces endolithicus]KAK0951998.1 hypothetical protein LTS01_025016 [Friedmanniomyces endolithicus]